MPRTIIEKIKILFKIFSIALVFNLIWENAQAPLYQGYESFSQHFWICFPASLWDAGYTTILLALAYRLRRVRVRYSFIVIMSLIIAAFIELRALAQGRWAYTAMMPIVPIIHVGLTPFLQLAILSIVTYTVVDREIAEPQRD